MFEFILRMLLKIYKGIFSLICKIPASEMELPFISLRHYIFHSSGSHNDSEYISTSIIKL